MKIKIQIGKYVAPIKRERILVSPQERFNRLSRRSLKRGNELRKYHFTVIEAGKTIIVFDGEGLELIQLDNSIEGYREARLLALHTFLSATNQNGGFLFNTPNLEYQSPEELEQVELSNRRNLEYNPFSICTECKFEFESREESAKHKCSDNWMILDFRMIRRIYV